MRNYSGRIMLPVNPGRLGTPAADSTIWSFLNKSDQVMSVRRVDLNAAFDGTAAATTQHWNLCRFESASDPSGGAEVAPICKRSAVAATVPDIDARQDAAGLTTTGNTFETPFAVLQNQRQVSAGHSLSLDYGRDSEDEFTLLPGEGIAIRVGNTGVAGDSIAGTIELAYYAA